MLSYKCTKCGTSVEFEPKDYKVVETEKVICSNCGAEYYIKNSPCSSFKENLKSFGVGLGKFAYKTAKVGLEILKNMQQEYDSAHERSENQGVDDWDENKLKQRMRYTGNFYEESIIRQKLSEKANEEKTE